MSLTVSWLMMISTKQKQRFSRLLRTTCLSVTTKNRLNSWDGDNIKFGLVVTLKELHGVNRIGDFIQMCSFNQWFTEEVDIENKIDDMCNIAATCADAALEFFEFNKEYMTKKEKKEISKKEHNKQSYR